MDFIMAFSSGKIPAFQVTKLKDAVTFLQYFLKRKLLIIFNKMIINTIYKTTAQYIKNERF